MYCLLVHAVGWNGRRGSLQSSRAFEYTEERILELLRTDDGLNYQLAATYPALFMSEDRWDEPDPIAHVGEILSIRNNDGDLSISYRFDPAIPPIRNSQLHELSAELEIADFEFSRTHWAMKDVDLFRVLLENQPARRQQPRVFQLNDPEEIQQDLVSVMMPFDRSFDGVFEAISRAAAEYDLQCTRADNIWQNPAIIDDVVELIDRSRVVICDCSGRNPNVFYEMGIAHTLGREVVLITQSDHDIPFDVRHLRYVRYLDNNEGRENLVERLSQRFEALR